MNSKGRRIPGDWHDGVIPANVHLDDDTLVETSYSFQLCRSERPDAIRIGRGSGVYSGTMFDLGPEGRVSLGECVMLNSPRIISDAEIKIGDYCLLSWNVVLMDTYRIPLEPVARREHLRGERRNSSLSAAPSAVAARPIRLGRNVWIGFEACVLPGVTIGEGSVVGARSVVVSDVPAFSVVAGNPARVIRSLDNDESPTSVADAQQGH